MSDVVHLSQGRSRGCPARTGTDSAFEPRCQVANLLGLMGAPIDASQSLPPLTVSWRRFHAAETLLHEGAPAEAIHFVRAGTFKLFRTTEDGYEQVLGFALRGEVLGFEALADGRHHSTAVALEESSVYSLPLNEFASLGQRLPQLDHWVHRAASIALMRRSELAELMSAVAAEVRLARFLLQLSRRMAECGLSPRRFHLRMSRRDIASYLGVAHETVSRSFGTLARLGWLSVDKREIEILELDRLKRFAQHTRLPADEALAAERSQSMARMCAG